MSMANESESETKVIKSSKSIKRVRFSDDVKRVDFEETDDSGSASLESDSKNAPETLFISPSEPDDLPSGESVIINQNGDPDYNLLPDDNNNNELLSCPQMITGTYQTYSQISDSSDDDCIDEQSECNISDNELKECNSPETHDLIELINETMSMAISTTTPEKSTTPEKATTESLQKEKESHLISSSETDSEKNDQDSIRDIKQKSGVLCLSRKRSLEGVLVEKQTSKLNNCLSKNNSAFKSADELKSAVYNAWNTVKNETSIVQSPLNIPVMKKNSDITETSDSTAYELWRKSKVRSKKMGHKLSESASQKSKSKKDLEESKMAFKAWKKKKDEILKHQTAEKYKKEEKEKFDSLMNERVKKTEAESAFSA